LIGNFFWTLWRLNGWSQWPHSLPHGSAATCLLGLWVRILPGAWVSCLLWLLCVVR
jgi:hypothetical protein